MAIVNAVADIVSDVVANTGVNSEHLLFMNIYYVGFCSPEEGRCRIFISPFLSLGRASPN